MSWQSLEERLLQAEELYDGKDLNKKKKKKGFSSSKDLLTSIQNSNTTSHELYRICMGISKSDSS